VKERKTGQEKERYTEKSWGGVIEGTVIKDLGIKRNFTRQNTARKSPIIVQDRGGKRGVLGYKVANHRGGKKRR